MTLFLLGALTGTALLLPTAPAPLTATIAPACARNRVAPAWVRMQAEGEEVEFEVVEQVEEVAAPPPAPKAKAVVAAVATPPAPLDYGPVGWGIENVSPDGSLVQRVEGKTRKTWKFNNMQKDRVHVAAVSEGRPVNVDIQLWIGPDWTPFMLKAYSEDGKARPIQTLVGTRNKAATIEVRNHGEYEFPISAASNYAEGAIAALPTEMPTTENGGERVDGGAIRSFPLDPLTQELEIVLKTDGRQLNAQIELLSGPNNAKQKYDVFTNNGMLNSLCVGFNTPDEMTTIRVTNQGTLEFPCYIHLKEK